MSIEVETTPRTLPRTEVPLDSPSLYINRELSWIEFNRRVLEEALDATHPLLERVKFLAIFSSNLDEFFMVRVAGLKQQMAAGMAEPNEDQLAPAEQLLRIRRALAPLQATARALLRDELVPDLARHGIYLLNYGDMSPAQQAEMIRYYHDEVFPVLTPLAVDPGHPFPHISNLSVNLGVIVSSPAGEEHFARIKVPNPLPRLVPVPVENPDHPQAMAFTWIEQIVAANLHSLFPGMEICGVYPFRVTRNADLTIQEDEADDLLQTIEEGVRQRHFGFAVRLTVDGSMPERLRDLLRRNLKLEPTDVYVFDGPLGFSSLFALHRLDRPELKDPPFAPRVARPLSLRRPGSGLDRDEALASASDKFFAALRQQDLLLHHPYDSFTPVVDFIRLAALDPNVAAIKQTLYRVGSNSPIVRALMRARENHKQVSTLVELKARFDEESNIEWARALERRGVHVVYGLLGLKTHAKVAMVVRKEADGLVRYLHLGTGNYNAVSALTYTDFGLFTCNEDFGADVSDLFNYLTGYSLQREYRKLLVAPVNMRDRMVALIERESDHGPDGHVIFKMNALVDPKIIQALYRASRAGVRIDLLVRGVCCLRPGVPGVSDNIRVTSIVGRFLEHSRAYYFYNRGADEVYLGSADMMPRNLIRRVEVLFPVEDAQIRAQLRQILEVYLGDNVKARQLLPDGRYVRVTPGPDEPVVTSQAVFLPARR